MDPFTMGLLAISGAQNPGAFAQTMAQLGITPEGFMSQFNGLPSGDSLGGFITGSALQPATAAPATTTGWEATVTPTAGAAPMGAAAPNPLSLLQGVKTPEAPKPLMNAGVSGAQKAPEAKVSQGQGSAADAIL